MPRFALTVAAFGVNSPNSAAPTLCFSFPHRPRLNRPHRDERKQGNRDEESTMISKTFRIARMVVLASFALSSAAWAATCSNASLSGTYGFLHDGTDSNGTPATAAVSQVTFDSTTGTFTGETTASHDGVIATEPLTGTYAVASNCTGTEIGRASCRESV